jgi:hypothetical protein
VMYFLSNVWTLNLQIHKTNKQTIFNKNDLY